ncbi:uncharacterized protein LOC110985915 [Acanthaster planci]|uniref:Uncharacterized protein LOC110985915 n=1 Tax=Acanthaster planci TaxID=133434 RepID=A0A8B7ZBL2_ACAPL|nr:uncharacterized protein LOC110985915 [Acanthaster planci]XP_022103070.1 uncharacterized protein LOC110985915 [Acanthaster planci]
MRVSMKRCTLIVIGVLNGVIIFFNYRAMSEESRQRSTDFIRSKFDFVKKYVHPQDRDNNNYAKDEQKRKQPLVWNDIQGIHKALPAYGKMRRVLSNLHDYKRYFYRESVYFNINGEMLQYKSVPHVGDSYHLRALFADVLQTNRSLRIGVIGGALSYHNVCLQKSCLYIDIVANWLMKILDTEVTVHNAAIGTTNSDYFAWCLQPHLDVENMDIIIWELATEDYVNRDVYFKHGLTNAAWPQEEITRRILALPNKPYLMYFNFLSTANIRQRECVNSEYFAGRHLAKHYNVTSISWCNAICTKLWKPGFTPDDLIFADNLLSKRAHHQGALFIIHYFRNILEEVTENFLNQTQYNKRYIKHLIALHDDFVQNTYGLGSQPIKTIKSKTHSNNITAKFSHVQLKDPQCWPISKPQFESNHSLEITMNEGWEIGYSYNDNWYLSTEPNQRITFKISIPPNWKNLNATIAIALVTCNYCGQALVWLNDLFGGAKLVSGNDKIHQFAVREIFTNVPPASYSVTIKSMEERPVKIGAVMTSYEEPRNRTLLIKRNSEQFGGPRMWNKLKGPAL